MTIKQAIMSWYLQSFWP